jgi:hypothetical protein
MFGGGLEPSFRVLVSAIFMVFPWGISISVEDSGRQWKIVEAKLLQIAASLPTFCVLVISYPPAVGYDAGRR